MPEMVVDPMGHEHCSTAPSKSMDEEGRCKRCKHRVRFASEDVLVAAGGICAPLYTPAVLHPLIRAVTLRADLPEEEVEIFSSSGVIERRSYGPPVVTMRVDLGMSDCDVTLTPEEAERLYRASPKGEATLFALAAAILRSRGYSG